MEEFEYRSLGSEGRVSWIWGKVLSFGKKVVTAGLLLSTAPFLVPPLLVVFTIAFISAVPYFLFLANYACTQKLMSSLLPATNAKEIGEIDKDESVFEDSKLGHAAVDEAEPWMALNEPTLSESKEDEENAKESTSLIEKIRDEGRSDSGIPEKDDEKSGNAKSDKVQDQPGKQQAPKTRHEGEFGTTTTESSTGKNEETSSNEPNDQAVSGPRGTGEDKPKNTTKKKRKTGRAGVQ